MKVLLLFPYPLGRAASQRFRFEQYLDQMRTKGIQINTQAFLHEHAWVLLYARGKLLQKVYHFILGFVRRFFLLFSMREYDYVFIHREAAPLGPPFFEWVIGRVLKKKIIYDFDDAIWLPNASDSNRFFAFLKFHGNVKRICKWSYKISCGNQYLCNYALQYNASVIYNPTTIDTINLHNRVVDTRKQKPTIGWTGSHSTNRYLQDMIPVIAELEKEFDFDFLVISDVSPELPLRSFKFKKWSKETEIDDLMQMTIGIMPLAEDQWAAGKCGFKALQYMSLGIPALVSPVGVNTIIVDHGINGYICNTRAEWIESLRQLLGNPDTLSLMSANTRKKIESSYSVTSNKANFIALFT
ncbi:MAG: glycosyltransferase [Bacteroidota bacterium]